MRIFPITPFFLACLAGLAACAAPPAARQPVSALQLASAELNGAATPARAALPPDTTPLPGPPPQEINQSGSLPAIGATAASPPATPPVAPADDIVTMDYEQVELRQVLQEIGDVLGLSMIIDPSIGDKVTMRTAADKPLHQADLWPLLQLLISDAGITMEKKGEVYHLKKLPSPLPTDIGGPGAGLGQSNAPEVMQVTPLRYVSMDAALTAIKPLVEPPGRVLSLPTLNLIGIITSPDRLRRVNQLLALVDADPFVHRGMRLYRLHNAKSTEVQGDLDKILKAVEGNMPAYQVIGLERINAIMVVAPPGRGFTQVDRWLDILDERNESGGEQVFIYRVRNLKATTLATTLTEVFKLEDKDAPKKPAQPAQPAIPLQPGQEPPPPTQPPVQPVQNKAAEGGAGVSAELKVSIVADEDTNTLVIRASPRDYRQLLETIAMLDQVPKEVMVNVVIAEVGLTEENRFGIDWSYWFGDRGSMGTNFGIMPTPRTRPSAASATAYDTFGFGTLTGVVINQVGNRLTSMLNMLATDNDVQVLSRPSLLVRNNQEASINVGSDQPTITQINTQSATTTTGNLLSSNQVQYRQTGIILKVTPHINEDGIINMEVSQEVSNVSTESGVESLPAFDQRKIETSVVVRDGSAIILGGLIETRGTNNNSGIPGLREVPVAGQLFSNTTNKSERTELVVIIVPQIVDPQADNRAMMEKFVHERMTLVSEVLNERTIPELRGVFPLFPEAPATQPEPPQSVAPGGNEAKTEDKTEESAP